MAQTEAAKSLQRFVRQDYWNGLAAGDVVRVAGHAYRGRHWRFRSHVTNTSNGATWVEVALVEGSAPTKRPAPTTVEVAANGTPAGEAPRVEKVRSFEPELVTPRWRARSRPRRRERAASPSGSGVSDEAEALQPSLF